MTLLPSKRSSPFPPLLSHVYELPHHTSPIAGQGRLGTKRIQGCVDQRRQWDFPRPPMTPLKGSLGQF